MAWAFSSGAQMLLFLSIFFLAGEAASLKFRIHNRFSDSVKGILNSDGLPEKHTPGYYAALVHRDRLRHDRRLGSTKSDTPLTFSYGNQTYTYSNFGAFYYANVSVGTPGLAFSVALDTGSDLSWLPCECSKCRTYFEISDGSKLMLNHYSPNASKTSKSVACSNSLCELADQCPSKKSTCPYKTHHLSPNTSSAGYLVEDILHLATDDSQSKPVGANITFGCGKVQTGRFSNLAANGLLGLGMGKISVPSLLASQELTPDSFSMCFGYEGFGRIDFGDIGPSDQRETPLNPNSSSYNVTIIQISVAREPHTVEFTAIFDPGSSYTYLTEPIYSLVTKKIDAAMELERIKNDSRFPFEYCYRLPLGTIFREPNLNFTMDGGYTYGAIIYFGSVPTDEKDGYVPICLTIAKSTDINLFGQNFLAGHRIVFNREKMVLGWKEMDCDDDGASNSPQSNSPPAVGSPPPGDSPPAPSTTGKSNSTQPLPGIGTGDATQLNPLAALCVAILAILSVV